MNKTLLVSKNIREENSRLDYYIIREKYIDISNNISTLVYGVEICRTDCSNAENIKKRAIHNISHNEKVIAQFINDLSEKSTAPEELYDIVSEKIDEDYFNNQCCELIG